MTVPESVLAVTLPLGIMILRKEIALFLRWVGSKFKGEETAVDTAADVLDPQPPEPPKAA